MKSRDLVIIVFAILLSFFIKWRADDFFMNTIYTVLGIVFSIGIGLVVSFNMSGITKKNIVNKIRGNLVSLRDSYMRYFTASTIFYILDKYFRDNGNILEFFNEYHFNFSIFALTIMLFSIAHNIYNFIMVQKLNDQIYDELNS